MSGRIRVLVLLPSLASGGGQKAVLEFCRGLNRERFDVRMLVHEPVGSFLSDIKPEDNVEFVLQRPYRVRDLPRALIETIKRAAQADIVLGGLESRASFCGLLAAKLVRKPYIAWVHIDYAPFLPHVSLFHRIAIRSYRWADKVVACSLGASDSFARLFGVPREKIEPIYNGLPIERIDEASREPLPPGFEEAFKEPTVVMVGRLHPQKGYPTLIGAHAKVIAEGVPHRLVIVGEGPLQDYLGRLVKERGVEGSVQFAGFRANPYPFMKNASVFALSAEFEGFGLVLVEAMVCGTPIVSTDCPSGPREVLQDGAYGMLVPPGDVDAFAAALKKLLTDRNAAASMAEGARNRARLFSIQKSSEEWEKLLLSLVPAGRRLEAQEKHVTGRPQDDSSTFGVNANH